MLKKPSNPHAIAIYVKNTRIVASETAKLLVVTMDKKLSMNKHFEEIYSRVQKRIPLLKLIAGNYNHPKAQPETTIAVYRTMIRPLDAPTALMLLKPHHLEQLERQQFKAAIQGIENCPPSP
jgi:hypothetical protein